MGNAPFDQLKLRQFLVNFAAESEQAQLQRTPATRQEYRDLVERHATKLQVMAVEGVIPMDTHRWLNIWKILRSIDFHEILDTGVPFDFVSWEAFRADSPRWLCKQDDETQAKVWAIVIARGG